MITELCQELNNFFIKSEDDKHFGTFKVTNGQITPSFDLEQNQYFRIVGSKFNDGVYKFGVDTLPADETIKDGALWCMYVPNDFINLVNEIEEWQNKYSEIVDNPYKSESFNGYSYSLKSGKSTDTVTYKDIFKSKLNKYRKIKI